MAAVQLIRAVGQQQHHTGAQVADQEAQQVTRGLVGPVQVLDHQQQRSVLSEPVQNPEQQLEQPAGHERTGPGCGLGPGLGGGAELGHEAGQLGAGTAEYPLQLGRVHGIAERAQRLDQRRIGDHPLADVQAAAGECQRPTCTHLGEQLGHQPGCPRRLRPPPPPWRVSPPAHGRRPPRAGRPRRRGRRAPAGTDSAPYPIILRWLRCLEA